MKTRARTYAENKSRPQHMSRKPQHTEAYQAAISLFQMLEMCWTQQYQSSQSGCFGTGERSDSGSWCSVYRVVHMSCNLSPIWLASRVFFSVTGDQSWKSVKPDQAGLTLVYNWERRRRRRTWGSCYARQPWAAWLEPWWFRCWVWSVQVRQDWGRRGERGQTGALHGSWKQTGRGRGRAQQGMCEEA